MNTKISEEWIEYRALCVKCHGVAVFKHVRVGARLHCDAGHYLGKAPKKCEAGQW